MTGDTANLAVEITSRSDELAIGPFLPRRASGGEEMDQRLDLLLAFRIVGEQVGHGRAGLDGLRIAEELAQMSRSNAHGHVVEDRRLLASADVLGLVATDAVQLAEEKLSTASL